MPILLKRWPESLRDYKAKEADIAFRGFLNSSYGRCLEIGAGDGFEATLIKNRFRLLVTTEREKGSFEKRDACIHYCACDAERLPFAGKSFDFVFSSSVIEHIRNKELCLSEVKRVLRDNGVVVHIVPSRTWKILNCLLLYPYLFLLLCNAGELKNRVEEKNKSEAPKGRILKYLIPRVHGEYQNHLAEFIHYGEKQWQALFESNGFKVINVIKLPLASGYGFNLDKMKTFLEKGGFSSTYAFVMVQKKEQ